MNPIIRGGRNAFRNGIRTVSITVILGASIALTLSMLLANHAVKERMDQLRTKLGTTILVRPAGSEEFRGGGEPLTVAQADKLKPLPNVTQVNKTNAVMAMKEEADTGQAGEKHLSIAGPGGGGGAVVQTNLESAVDAGTLGKRFHAQGNGPEGSAPPSIPIPVQGVDGDRDNTGEKIVLKEGRQLNAQDGNVALVGAALATKNNLKLGSTFTLGGQTFTVVGIYDAGTKFGNNSAKIPFTKAAELSKTPNEVSTIVVQARSLDDVSSVQQAIKDALGETADVSLSDPSAQSAVEGLKTVEKISFVGFVASLGTAAAVILLTMLMIVRERRREIGVLKAIGAKTHKIVTQFVAEAMTLSLMAAIVGFGLAILMSNTVISTLINSNVSSSTGGESGPMLSEGPRVLTGALGAVESAKDIVGTLQTSIGWETLLIGFAVALLIALIGSAVPAWIISKIRPAEVMRNE